MFLIRNRTKPTILEALAKSIQTAQKFIKSQMAFDFGNPDAHHVAYTRTNARGTVSNIKAKGAPIAKQFQTQPGETYFKGDKARYTGKSEEMHGGLFHEIEMLEGHLKGQKQWTPRAPDVTPTLMHHSTVPSSPMQEETTMTNTIDEKKRIKKEEIWKRADGLRKRQKSDLIQLVKQKHRVIDTNGMDKQSAINHILESEYGNKTLTELYYHPVKRPKVVEAPTAPLDTAGHNTNGSSDVPPPQEVAKTMTEAEAGTRLNHVASHNVNMTRKADEWSDAHQKDHEVSAELIAGTEARHYTTTEVYGTRSPSTYARFKPEFVEKQPGLNDTPFVLIHEGKGQKYLVDPQGYDYARYIARVKPALTPAPMLIKKTKTETANPEYIGNPKKLIEDIAKKLNITYGRPPHVTPLRFTVNHDHNMVTIGYKNDAATGRGVMYAGITQQTVEQQKTAFAAAASQILAEVKKHYKLEDESIEPGSLFFVSDDMIPGKGKNPAAEPTTLEKHTTFANEMVTKLRELGVKGAGVYISTYPGRVEVDVTVGDWDNEPAAKFQEWASQNAMRLQKEGINLSRKASLGVTKDDHLTIVQRGDYDHIREPKDDSGLSSRGLDARHGRGTGNGGSGTIWR